MANLISSVISSVKWENFIRAIVQPNPGFTSPPVCKYIKQSLLSGLGKRVSSYGDWRKVSFWLLSKGQKAAEGNKFPLVAKGKRRLVRGNRIQVIGKKLKAKGIC